MLSVLLYTQISTVLHSYNKHIFTSVWMEREGSRFLPVGAWHVEKALLLDLLAPLHAVSDGVTVQHSHIHTDIERELHWFTVHCSPRVAFSCPPSTESIKCLPLPASWGVFCIDSDKLMKHWQQGTVGCIRDTVEMEFDRRTERNMACGKVIHWLVLKESACFTSHLNSLNSQSDNSSYTLSHILL